MSESTVAEIIGAWRPTTCRAGCCRRWESPTGRVVYGPEPPRPSVDDMLSWLVARGETRIESWTYDDEDGAQRLAIHVDHGADAEVYEGPHDSMLCALEATVQQVASLPDPLGSSETVAARPGPPIRPGSTNEEEGA